MAAVRADPARRWVIAAVITLTVGTGATNVASFTRLGGVFTSVMTANMVLFGLSLATRSAVLAAHTAVAFGGYVLGAAAGARMLASRRGSGVWPPMVTVALGVEFVLLAVLAAGWELAGARPAGAGQYLLQLTAAAAMGLQSAAVGGLGRGEFTTTYLTGTLTGLVGDVPGPGRPGAHGASPAWCSRPGRHGGVSARQADHAP
jgi:uncharacterized membrane protein YoaK (UPF0700 family)